MRGFDRSNPPPVTITGVAPWAVAGAGQGQGQGTGTPNPGLRTAATGSAGSGTGIGAGIGSIGSTSAGISMTAMPKRMGLPFNPAGRSTSAGNAPPNALTTTIQEAKRARERAQKYAESESDEHAQCQFQCVCLLFSSSS